VDAVFLDKELPDDWRRFEGVNAAFFQTNKAVASLQADMAACMAQAVSEFAGRSGLSVATVVLDREGAVLNSTAANASALEDAMRKAYTALMYGVATHELKAGARPLWRRPDEIDAGRVLIASGAYPIIEGVETLGAVGVAGATPQQDQLCCQAAVGARLAALSH
jgi:uncharacterized protein GlcG (DUF336 family)